MEFEVFYLQENFPASDPGQQQQRRRQFSSMKSPLASFDFNFSASPCNVAAKILGPFFAFSQQQPKSKQCEKYEEISI